MRLCAAGTSVAPGSRMRSRTCAPNRACAGAGRTELVALPQDAGQPLSRRLFDQVQDLEDRGVDLGLRLLGVASVDEQRRFVPEHDREAGGTRKARHPQEPLRVGRHVFVLMLIGSRDDEPVETLCFESAPERPHPFRAVRRPSHVRERLKPAFEHAGPLPHLRRTAAATHALPCVLSRQHTTDEGNSR